MSGSLSHLAALRFHPLIPGWLLLTLGLCCAGAISLSLVRRAGPGAAWRGLAFALLLCWLGRPVLVRQDLRALGETLLLVVDQTGSMRIGDRAVIARRAADRIAAEAARLPGLDVRVVPVGPAGSGPGGPGGGTRLIGAIERAAAAIPAADGRSRIAGIVAVTDGQVHDLGTGTPAALAGGDIPLHVLIPARGEQTDRRLRVLQAPPFAIVGQDATLRVQVDDLGVAPAAGGTATLTLHRDGDAPVSREVAVGEPQDITVPIARPGQTLLELDASTRPGEVSSLNNQAIVAIQGVRDRLKVLLVSGTPNQGERVWRRLLKADPSVDLVHFTILRPPDKDDTTPLNELALIAFPIRELFQEKVNQFDLIILDGFENRGILPMAYLRNIADFVRGGGGLLVTAGPEFIGAGTLQDTPLGEILPARVPEEGGLVEQRFQPMPTALGRRHPVTGGLPQMPAPGASAVDQAGGSAAGGGPAGWGPWYRALHADPAQLAPGAQVLLDGPDASPLLILDRVEQGRVALLLSDQLWLWSRGEDGGGPQAELLRRVAHWLMKEPELEEERLTASVADGRLDVTRRSVAGDPATTVTVIAPDGTRTPLALSSAGGGTATAGRRAAATGIWQVTDGREHAFAAATPADPLEIADLRATATVLGPLAAATGGSVGWLGGDPARPAVPGLRLVGPHERATGAGWIGLRRHGAHVVTGEQTEPLLPAAVVLPLALLLLLGGWRAEGRA